MRKLLVALGATFVVLLGTGLYQAFRYMPHVEVVRLGQRSLRGFERTFVLDATELIHRIGAYAFAALAVAVIVVWIRSERSTTRWTLISVVVLTVLALATLAAIITGRGIRWQQVALSVVTRGTPEGVVDLPDGLKLVLVDGAAVSPSEFSTRVFLHLVVFPIGLVLVAGVLWFLSTRNARGRAERGATAGPDDTDDRIEVHT